MLLTRDMPRRAILRRMQLGSLLLGHHTVGLGLVFHSIDMCLLVRQAVGFLLSERAARDAVVNPPLLVHLTLIDDRRLRLIIGRRYKENRSYRCTPLHCCHEVLLR